MNKMKKIALGVVTAMTMIEGAGCSTAKSTKDLKAVVDFDAVRYMGKWHEIARLPQWYERDLMNVTAHYELDGGKLKIVNRGFVDGKEKTATAVGHFVGDANVGDLKVSFFWPFYGGYKVLWVSPEYDCALVTGDDRSSLWILAREPQIAPALHAKLMQMAKELGYDVEALEYPGEGGNVREPHVSRYPFRPSGKSGI
ncbi:MAG: lipocalin family protein [Kiritimatiellae bacterium]|nr:lipocalin family protein [Kiritimatiellia bacterium]